MSEEGEMLGRSFTTAQLNICYVHRGGPAMASYRYRCAIPGKELEKNGHSVSFNGGNAHICVFSKPEAADMPIAKDIQEKGCVIVVDIGDNHFAHSVYGPIYAEMLQIADYIVCPTPVMREIMTEFTDKDITVIPDPYDPYQIACRQPHADGEKLLWFGHRVNLYTINPYLKLDNLQIVTGPGKIEDTTEWSPETLNKAMHQANKVLLPTTKDHHHKTANRLINSLRAGLFPICDPHPAYDEFKSFVWGNDIMTGVRWSNEYGGDLNELVAEGQAYIEKHYSPEVIGRKWLDLFDSI